jgi:hypothetical protein
MSAEIFTFPGKRGRSHPPVLTEVEFDALPDHIKAECTAMVAEKKSRRQAHRGSRVNIRTLCFRSREALLESDEADLVRDVCRDLHKAEVKLMAIRQRLQGVQEWSAAQIEQLTAAETKLSAAIVAALLSGQR